MRPQCILATCLLAALPALARAQAVQPRRAGGVEVRRERITYPVNQQKLTGKYESLKVNPKLTGKTEYTTEAIVLENRYVKVTVLPEFGARMPRVVFKHLDNRDAFWVNDVLEDTLPWSMGGIRFSFPFYEHGRHMDEGAGWRIVERPDGSVVVAMDMRFRQHTGEVQRYGRFSLLRQATEVTLRPETAMVEYTSRVENDLPIRHGFRLWSVAHLARVAGAELLWPVGSVTDHGAPAMHTWPTWDGVDHSVLGTWGTSSFSLDLAGNWAGLYYPQAGVNHLLLRPRYSVPGLKLYAGRLKPDKAGRWDTMIEIWCGSNRIFEHPGHYLPPFGTYEMPIKVALVGGIGKVAWADERFAVGFEPGQGARGAVLRIKAYTRMPRVWAAVRSPSGTVRKDGPVGPETVLELEAADAAGPVTLFLFDADQTELAKAEIPVPIPPTPDTLFKTLKAEMEHTWVFKELSDWPREHAPNLAAANQEFAKGLSMTNPERVVHAARIMMRTEPAGSATWHQVKSMLERVVREHPERKHAALYLAMMEMQDSGGTPSKESRALAEQAARLPAAQYVLGLHAIGEQNPAGALAYFLRATSTTSEVAMGMGDLALGGNQRLHPAAMVSGTWPNLVRADLMLQLQRTQQAINTLRLILQADPARAEAMALLAEAYKAAGDREKAKTAQTEAARLFEYNDQARRDLERLRKAVAEGLLVQFPKP